MILSRFIAAICKILIRLKHFRVSGPAAFFSYPLFLFLPNHLLVCLHCAEWACCSHLHLDVTHVISTKASHTTAPRRTSWSKDVMGIFFWTAIFLDNNVLLGPLLGRGRWLLLFLTSLIPNGNFCCFGSKGRPLLWGFPDLGRASCACASAGCCFRMEKRERKNTYLLLRMQSNM